MTVVRQAQVLPVAPASASVPREALPERLELAAPCIPRAAHPEEHPREHAPASDSVLDPEVVLALAHVPVSGRVPDLYRLPARRRVRSARAPTLAAAASNILRPKKVR